MCNDIKDDGAQCKLAKGKDRCERHVNSNVITSMAIAENMIEAVRNIHMKTDGDTRIVCLCGSITQRWNFSSHCSSPKHRRI
jgi:hypothetical protein